MFLRDFGLWLMFLRNITNVNNVSQLWSPVGDQKIWINGTQFSLGNRNFWNVFPENFRCAASGLQFMICLITVCQREFRLFADGKWLLYYSWNVITTSTIGHSASEPIKLAVTYDKWPASYFKWVLMKISEGEAASVAVTNYLWLFTTVFEQSSLAPKAQAKNLKHKV